MRTCRRPWWTYLRKPIRTQRTFATLASISPRVPRCGRHAAGREYTIVTKDADFHHRSLLHGHPLKVIWILLNSRHCAIVPLRQQEIEGFLQSTEHSFLLLA
jgi:hypothetical protein